MTYRILFEPRKAPLAWGVEMEDGERVYVAALELAVPARTVFIPDDPRPRGYLECEGRLVIDGETARIEGEL